MGILLPGVKTVEICEISSLPDDIMEKYLSGEQISLNNDFYILCIKGIGSCDTIDKIENNQSISETKLVFFMEQQPIRYNTFMAYRITDITGHKYLIGTKERPFPIRQVVRNNPSTMNNKKGYTITISYTNIVSLIPLSF